MKKTIFTQYGQSTIEFSFCFALVLLLFYGCMMLVRWAGLGLAERRIAHDEVLTHGIRDDWKSFEEGPLQQLNPDFYDGMQLNLYLKK